MITLIRHAKVNYNFKKYYRYFEFDKACKEYDNSPICKGGNKTFPCATKAIYVSSLKRTHDTAKLIFLDENYIENKLFDEVPLKSFSDLLLPMPTPMWFAIGRLQWFFGIGQQPESRQKTKDRARQAIDVLEKEKREVILICHGLFMRVLVRELKNRGYTMYGKANYNNLGSIHFQKP